jgi:hypothetical protein
MIIVIGLFAVLAVVLANKNDPRALARRISAASNRIGRRRAVKTRTHSTISVGKFVQHAPGRRTVPRAPGDGRSDAAF